MTRTSARPARCPDGFLWGASTSAHQTEGANTASDWWALEHSGLTDRIEEPSGDACDSYHRWREDMDLLAGLGFTDYRFSIEWARVEPAPGLFSRAAIAHYRRMVEGALARGLRPMITLHHFTAPLWFAERGGWTAPEAPEAFARFVRSAAPVFTDGVEHVCTINEPNMVAVMAAVRQTLTVGGTLPALGLPLPDPATTTALVAAHRRAVDTIKTLSPHIRTGWSVANQAYQAVDGAEDITAAHRHPREDVFLEAARGDDWLGVQSYSRNLVGPDGPLPVPEGAERTAMGWEFYPEALGEALRHSAAVAPGVPLVVTENGIATDDDSRRIDYTTRALASMTAAMADGADVRGYFHWSALDNYEWGTFAPAFGLIAVNRRTFVRSPKPSAAWLGSLNPARTTAQELA
ncbi:glycoside hydrolase family 1 protein [Streptomyces nymphaeiformis]|uniref:Beta-glucosidase n=1 Tax=Streptomyces nymphaeiformis TaxID=2663842 RepID=A0A7W7X9Z6_9ACTN|nr:family 1 glycosylhydrolase [Streptomyces nymphaeiformis]MBB4980974.1 beta-glucosidase [Streptomyces nymphaeiformis]